MLEDDSIQSEQPSESTLPVGLILRALTLIGSLFLIVVFAFSLLGKYFLLAELISSFRYQLAGLLLPFAIASLCLRQRFLSLILLAIIGWNFASFASVYLPSKLTKPIEQSISIMSLNLLADNWDHDRVIESVQQTQPEILMLLEYSNHWHKKFRVLHDQYPYRVMQPRWHGYGIAAFSKRPISDVDVVQLTADQTDVPAVVFRVDCGDRTLRLAGMHTMSPTNRFRLDLRNRQIREIGDRLGVSDEPTVLMGDFNCVPWSAFMQGLLAKTGYRDSRKGHGFHATWHSALPGLLRIPIDHVLVSTHVDIYHREVGADCGSDHLPVIVRVAINGNAPYADDKELADEINQH